jgi:dihydrofolate synthase/folylpolyglutamate synthase
MRRTRMPEPDSHQLPGDAPLLSYQETLEYLYARLPMFTRIGEAALKADLTNTIELCGRIGNPQNSFKSIHIAGTNGKGSTSHMLAAILQTAGYKTGLYTSPHLKDFRERIRVNGEVIPEEDVVNFVNSERQNIEEIAPSFFEVSVAMAFQYFATQQVDIAVIEVGLGGRLDSTNIINPLVSVITNIGFDHVNILGKTLPEIASEKAGIIKNGVPVVIGEKHSETLPIFLQKARQMRAPLIIAADHWLVERSASQRSPHFLKLDVNNISGKNDLDIRYNHLEVDLTGSYQLKNVATVLSAIRQLRQVGFTISIDHVKAALKNVKHLTGLQGRWQMIRQKPLTICDTGHNEDGIREVIKNIDLQHFEHLHIVIGLVQDKDITKILALLPLTATYYFCSPDMPRAKPAKDLKEEAHLFGLEGDHYNSVAQAFQASLQNAGDQDMIFVGGSTFVVAEVL